MRDAELAAALQRFLSAQLGHDVEVRGLARMPGGASRETWAVELVDRDRAERLVLRRDPPGAPAATSRADEYRLLQAAAAAGVPVPAVRWLVSDSAVFGAPGFFMDHVDGETIPRRILRDPPYADLRPVLVAQCGAVAAAIHAIDLATTPFGDTRADTAAVAHTQLDQYLALLDDYGEPHPAFELGLAWLRERVPPPRPVGLVHGDFRTGNFVVGPDGIRAVLDWELAHAGDPMQDLGWLCVRAWRFGADGHPAGGFGSRQHLFAAYEAAGGDPVVPDIVRFWEVFGTLKWGVMCITQAMTHLSGFVWSVELASLGRRVCEMEHDVLALLDGRD